jgi:hypothetical protein
VKEQVAQLFDDPLMLTARLSLDISPALLRQMTERCDVMATELRSRTGGPLRDLVSEVRALEGWIEIDLSIGKIAELIGFGEQQDEAAPYTLSVDFRLTRTGIAIRLIQDNGALAIDDGVDAAILKQVLQARRWWEILAQGEVNIAELAGQEGVTRSYISRVIDVAFLAPAVIDAILEGRQRGELNAGMLRETGSVPAMWDDQVREFLPKTAQNRH